MIPSRNVEGDNMIMNIQNYVRPQSLEEAYTLN